MLKKMNNMNIKGRLNYVFRLIIIAFSVVAVVISAMMIYMSMDYRSHRFVLFGKFHHLSLNLGEIIL